MSRRTERVGSLIRNILAEALRTRINDPRIEPMTSITRVEVTPDISLARVYVSVLAPPGRRHLCVDALTSARGRLRTCIAERVTLRQVPALEFHLDESLQNAFETVRVLDEIHAELHARDTAAENPPDDDAASEDQPPQEDR